MNVQQSEQAILATILVDRGAAKIIKAELSPDKFIYGPAKSFSDSHAKIYGAMMQISGRIDTLSISNVLGEEDLEKVGGASYLQFLATACLPQLGIRSTESLPQWVLIVDSAGRLKQVGSMFEDYSRLFDDFELQLEQISDVDTFIADIQERLSNIALGSTNSSYEHISTATKEYGRILEDEAHGRIETCFPVGWPSLEKFAIPAKSSLMVISGLSSIGKSQLMLQLILGMAIQIKAADAPGCVGINSYEMSGWRCVRRMAACLAGVDYQSKAARDIKTDEYRLLNDAIEIISTLPIYYDDSMTPAQVAINATKMHVQQGPVMMLGVDYAEEQPDDKDYHSEELRISNKFRAGKRLATALGMCYCMLSQVSGISAFPTAIVPYNQLRYSRGATNSADTIVYLYNPPQMREMRIPFTFDDSLGDSTYAYAIVQKNRDGKLGAFPLEWTAHLTRFRDPALVDFRGSLLYRNLDKLYVEDF